MWRLHLRSVIRLQMVLQIGVIITPPQKIGQGQGNSLSERTIFRKQKVGFFTLQCTETIAKPGMKYGLWHCPDEPLNYCADEPLNYCADEPLNYCADEPLNYCPDEPLNYCLDEPLNYCPDEPLNYCPDEPLNYCPDEPLNYCPDEPLND